MQDDNPILISNIANLIGSNPDLPSFEPERRATALKALQALQAQQVQISADQKRPSRLALLARTCMITVAAIVVLILIWSIPSAKHTEKHAAKMASLNTHLKEQQAEIIWLRAQLGAPTPDPQDDAVLFDEFHVKTPLQITPESLLALQRMAPLLNVLRDMEIELSETTHGPDHPEVVHLRDVITSLRATIRRYLSEENITSFMKYRDKYSEE